MTDQQTPPQEQPQTITKEGLAGYHAEFGEKAWLLHELQARLAAVSSQQQAFVAELRAFQAKHADGKCRPIVADEPTIADAEALPAAPTPIVKGGARPELKGAG